MGEETAFKTFVEEEFETHYVPNAFEEISRQFLIRLNRSGRIIPPFFKIDEKSYLFGLCFLNILPGIFSSIWPPISMPWLPCS